MLGSSGEPKWVPWGAHLGGPWVATTLSPFWAQLIWGCSGGSPWVARECCHCGRHNDSLRVQVEPGLVVQGIGGRRVCWRNTGWKEKQKKTKKKTTKTNKKRKSKILFFEKERYLYLQFYFKKLFKLRKQPSRRWGWLAPDGSGVLGGSSPQKWLSQFRTSSH